MIGNKCKKTHSTSKNGDFKSKKVRKPQYIKRCEKKRSIDDIQGILVVSWTTDEEPVDNDSQASLDMALSNHDQANIEVAACSQMERFAFMRTSLRQNGSDIINPSPHSMQHLISYPGNLNSWSRSLFAHIREEGMDLTIVEKDRSTIQNDDDEIVRNH